MAQNKIDISKLTHDERMELARAIALQQLYLDAAIRMTRRNLRAPLLKRNMRK